MRELSQKDIDRIIEEIPGSIAVYQVDGANLRSIRYSPDIPGFSGYTDEEYRVLGNARRRR